MVIFIVVFLFPGLYLLLHFYKWAFIDRDQACYVLGYECFKPGDDRRVSTQFSGEIITRNKNLGLNEYKFLLKAVVSSGIGEHTYGPRNILMGREDSPTLADALSEMDEFFQDSIPKLLSKSGISAQEIDVLVVNISMFASVPSLTSRIVNYYKMREDIKAYNLSGMGCSASLISINLVQSIFKYEKEKYALVVTSESLSPNWYIGNDRSMILSNCLFRSGGCAILLTNDRAQCDRAMLKLKCLVRTHHGSVDESYGCCIQMEDSQGRLGFHLSKSLPKSATRCLADNLKELAPRVLPMWEVARFILVFMSRRFIFRPNKAGIEASMAMFFIPAAISLIPAAFEGIAAAAAVVAGGLALSSATRLLEDRQEPVYDPPPSPPRAPPSRGATSLIPAAVVGGLAIGHLLKDPPRPPTSPPRRVSKEDLKKLTKKAMKGLIKKILIEAAKKMIKEIMEDKQSNSYKQEHVNAWGPMENKTQMVEMKLKDQHVWCGHFKSGPPPNNRKDETVIDKVNKNPAEVIWHRGVPPSGSKAAVAYSAHSRHWILAWHVPLRSSSSSSNKIYVECGPERPIDWNIIEKRLDASSNESECDGAVAEITDGADARIAAIFYE